MTSARDADADPGRDRLLDAAQRSPIVYLALLALAGGLPPEPAMREWIAEEAAGGRADPATT